MKTQNTNKDTTFKYFYLSRGSEGACPIGHFSAKGYTAIKHSPAMMRKYFHFKKKMSVWHTEKQLCLLFLIKKFTTNALSTCRLPLRSPYPLLIDRHKLNYQTSLKKKKKKNHLGATNNLCYQTLSRHCHLVGRMLPCTSFGQIRETTLASSQEWELETANQ